MAFPKSKSRRIVINDHSFRWIATSYYKAVKLSVISETYNGQKLFATFPQSINGEDANKFTWPFIIEPKLVRSTILYALANGYQPETNAKDLNLGDVSNVIKIAPNEYPNKK